MKPIKLNPLYVLKPDKGKALIMATLPGRGYVTEIEDSFTLVVHPIYAMILSFVDGRDMETCIEDASSVLSVSKTLIESFIDRLIDNPNQVWINNSKGMSAFPPNMIISCQEEKQDKRFNAENFGYDNPDLRMDRHQTPSCLTLMVNNICMTDCIYCYQDKSRVAECEIPLERIIEIIREARSLNVVSFDVIGGEFFLYKYWREVLSELRKYGYMPYLSTKVPLPEEDVRFLADIGIFDIQVSLDSMIEDHLKDSLRIETGYVSRMEEFLKLLDKYGIGIRIHSVLTKYTSSVEDMESIYKIVTRLKNFRDWHTVTGDEPLYPKVAFSEWKTNDDDLQNVCKYLQELKDKTGLNIKYPPYAGERDIMTEIEHPADDSKEDTDGQVATKRLSIENNALREFNNRAACSGLLSSLYILPDGNVQMCEQLYWNKDFIIGNVLESSIEEIWNSDKANSLFYIRQEDIPEDSRCHTCEEFHGCRSVKQVCYREIIRKHGSDKWYYPDVKCPYVQS